jgi:hypothetical protein
MVLIIKRKNQKECFVVKMSERGNPYGDPNYVRLMEIVENKNLDRFFNRSNLYKIIIDKLIEENKWNRNRSYEFGDVPNTMHDWIVSCFNHFNIIKYFIEVDESVFRN